MHYYRRYQAHLDSRKHEARTRQKVADKIAALEGRDTDLKDYSWLMQVRSAMQAANASASTAFGHTLAPLFAASLRSVVPPGSADS